MPPACITVIRFESFPIGDGFTFDSRYIHLTYKKHVRKCIIDAVFRRLTTIAGVADSHVWETVTHDDGSENDHTHYAKIFDERVRFSGSRRLDIDYVDEDGQHHILHPNILPVKSAKQMEVIFMSYHRGWKQGGDGKMHHDPPVQCIQDIPPELEFSEMQMQELLDAKSLVEACNVVSVRAHTVADVRALRDSEAKRPCKFTHKHDRGSFKSLIMLDTWAVVWIWGATGSGKTKWACAQFENPLLIKPFNSVGALEAIKKQFVEGHHDGIVCDEADLGFMKREQAIAFLDADEPATLDVRFSSFTLLPVKKIFISNFDPAGLLPIDTSGAIARRIDIILPLVDGQLTYYPRGQPLPGFERTASPLTAVRPFVAPRGLHTPVQTHRLSPLGIPPPEAFLTQ